MSEFRLRYICWLILGLAVPLAAQTGGSVSAQIQQLTAQLAAAQARLAADQAALTQLQGQVAQLQQQTAAAADQQAVTQGQVASQEQTKVSSGSLYHLTLSGLMLMNLYGNQGRVENSDVPNLAFGVPPGAATGDLGASLRQSEISLRVAGPELWGGKTSGELIADFFGGLPNSLDGSAGGLARLKIARGRLDWSNTSLLFGLDTPLISPLEPTSYASVAVPAFGYSGNLWTWTPQVAVEQRTAVGAAWTNTLQAGVMDPLSGEFPASTRSRKPEPGEASRQPGFELHEGLSRRLFDRGLSLGAGAYTSDQYYGFGRSVRAWAVTGDWQVPLTPWLEISGEAFRGRALGGLWGAVGDSIVSSATDLTQPGTQIAGLNAAGGWTQLKFTASQTVEFNAAYGLDDPFSGDLQRFAAANPSQPFQSNRTWLANVINRPRSDLILALEYRRLATTPFGRPAAHAGQLNAAVGVIF